MQFIQHQGCKVAYQQQGTGTPVVLLHGFCEDSTMWADFMPFLTKKYCVICVDLSGFGQSELLPETGIQAMGAAVLAVLKAIKSPPAVLIGHSMGGYVGLAIAAIAPQALLGLGLFHSHPYADSPERIKNRQKTIQFIQRHGIAPFAGHFVRNLFPPAFVKQQGNFIEDLIHHTSTHHSDAVIAASEAMIARPDQSDVLTQLPVPALFIVGKLDSAIPLEFSLQQLSLPAVALVHIFEHIGHMGMFEAPTACKHLIEEFVDFCLAQATVNTAKLA